MRAKWMVFLALVVIPWAARADGGGSGATYDVTGNMEFVSGSSTEQINYSFDVSYSGSFYPWSVTSGMQFSSTGPFAISYWDDDIATSEYVGFFDAAGDEFDLYVQALDPSAPSIGGAVVWGCKTAECETLYGGNSFGRTDMLYYEGTVDPEITLVETPEPSAMLLILAGLCGLAIAKAVRP